MAFAPVDAPAQESSTEACPSAHLVPYQIRASTCELASHVMTGVARSETFRRQIERIGALKGIVYIEVGHYWNPNALRVLEGFLQHRVTMAGDYRLLYIRIGDVDGPQAVSLIAHELQHAIEVLESGASTEAEIDALFDRIGSSAGAWVTETEAATEAARTVARELAASAR